MTDERLREALKAIAATGHRYDAGDQCRAIARAALAATPETPTHIHPGDFNPNCALCATPETPTLTDERLREARAIEKAQNLRRKTERVAISSEDWRFLNGYEDALYDLGLYDRPRAIRLAAAPETPTSILAGLAPTWEPNDD